MRVWIDVTNSPHVVFFRPLVALLEERGHEVEITARDFAQTLELLEDAGLPHTVVGPPHAGASRLAKVRAMASRLRALRSFARGERLRRRALSRLARASPRSAVAADPVLVRVRLRVRPRAARDRLPRRDTGRRPRGDPAGPPRPGSVRARARSSATQGSRRSTTSTASLPTAASSTRSGSTARGSSSSCGRRPRCRSTTGTGTSCSPTCRAARERRHRSMRLSCRGRRRSAARSPPGRFPRSSCPTARSTR